MDDLLNPTATSTSDYGPTPTQSTGLTQSLLLLFFSAILVYIISSAVYYLRFHPLSKYPGPPLAAFTNILFGYWFIKGESVQWIDRLHAKYGDVVRTGPTRLSYTAPQAFKDIYGHRTGSHKANPKNPMFSQPVIDGSHSVLNEEDEYLHGRQRKIFSNAFSDRALGEQEGLIQRYIDKVVQLIHHSISKNLDETGDLDVVKMYNFATFDIMADLTFGESLGNLDNAQYHPWVGAMFTNLKSNMIHGLLELFPGTTWVFDMLTPKSFKEEALIHLNMSKESVTKRLEKDAERPDIWGLVMKRQGENQMSRGEMNANSFLFMFAGTETTATLLSGVTWLLLKNPEKYEKLVREVRSVGDASMLTSQRLRHMKYLVGVLEEGLRLYPPVPATLMRDVPVGGNCIMGDWLPEKTSVGVPHFSAFRSPLNFYHPEKFVPERWILDEPDYKVYHEYDKRETLQPFSFGPRNCLGKNLAYYEMRSLLGHVVYNFDMELIPASKNWMINQKNWQLWDKPPLMVRFTTRK